MAFIRITLRIKKKNFELQKSTFRPASQNLFSGIFGGIVATIRFEEVAELAFDFLDLGVLLGMDLKRQKISFPYAFKSSAKKCPTAGRFFKAMMKDFLWAFFVRKQSEFPEKGKNINTEVL